MNELVISEYPKSQLLVVMDPRPFRASLANKPSWVTTGEWISLLVWLALMSEKNVSTDTNWYRLIDYVYRAMLQCLQRQRLVNVDIKLLAQETLPTIAEVYRWVTPIIAPPLELLYPQLQQGFKIQFDQLTMEGCYLLLVLK